MTTDHDAREDLERQQRDPRGNDEVDELSAGERAPAERPSTFRRRWLGFGGGLLLAALVWDKCCNN